jgi:hypothetical protein
VGRGAAQAIGACSSTRHAASSAPSAAAITTTFQNFIPLMEQHEGFPTSNGTFPQYSHTGIYSRELPAKARKQAEAIVRKFPRTPDAGTNESNFRFDVKPAFQKIVDDAIDESLKLDRTNAPPPLAAIPFCAFSYYPS